MITNKTIYENDNLRGAGELMMAYGDRVGYQTLFVKRIEDLVRLGLLKPPKSAHDAVELTDSGKLAKTFIKISYRVLGIKNAGH